MDPGFYKEAANMNIKLTVKIPPSYLYFNSILVLLVASLNRPTTHTIHSFFPQNPLFRDRGATEIFFGGGGGNLVIRYWEGGGKGAQDSS